MARPDSLIEGNCYFYVNYGDKELRVPVITTIRYVERMTGKGKASWVFELIPSAMTGEDGFSELPLMAFDESQLSRVLQLPDLQRTLNELAAIAPAIKEPPIMTIDDLLRKHDLKQHIESFLKSSHVALSVRIRYTDDVMFLDKDKDSITVGFYLHPLRVPEENSRLENLFKSLSIAPNKDYLADNGRTRILSYRLKAAITNIAELCGRILVDVYKIKTNDSLEYVLR